MDGLKTGLLANRGIILPLVPQKQYAGDCGYFRVFNNSPKQVRQRYADGKSFFLMPLIIILFISQLFLF